MNIPLVDLRAQYASIKGEVDAAIQRVIDGAAFILGKEVEAFEAEFADFCGAEHCVGVASGTAALHLALRACGIGPGDEVITTPFTFTATAEAIFHCGATPVFVDINPRTYNMDAAGIEAALSERTRAILPVHLYGQPADVDAILAAAHRHGLRVIDDAAQAHGARYKGRRLGPQVDATCFSFYPGKNLGAYGDAGAVVTQDPAIDRRVRLLRDHGRESKYKHLEIGFGERLDALQAAVLRVKLPHLEEWNRARRDHARRYSELLSGGIVTTPSTPGGVEHVYHLYVIRSHRRDRLFEHLKRHGIDGGIHYPLPLHLQPAYASLGYGHGKFPAAEAAADEVLSLPMYPELTEAQIRRVVEAVGVFRSAER